jgi:peptidoglycan/xylan/chitin deacetylase (PgdA/CDA1 family)
MLYAGIDWHDAQYEILLMDDKGVLISGFRTAHNIVGQKKLIETLLGFAEHHQESVTCIILSSNGVLCEYLLHGGLAVSMVRPRTIDEFRQLLPSHMNVSRAFLLAELGRQRLAELAYFNDHAGLVDSKDETLRVLERFPGPEETNISPEQAWRDYSLFWQGSSQRPEVALTFDDGPNDLYTPRILDVLKHYDIQATFFCIGLQIQSYPEITRRIHKEGHRIENHTWSHPYLSSLPSSDVPWQLARMAGTLQKVTGTQTCFFRPPYAACNAEILLEARASGFISTLWSVDPYDWDQPGTEQIVQRVLHQTQNGAIILLHDGGGDRSQTVEALPLIIEQLLDSRFSFVPLRRLVEELPFSVLDKQVLRYE